jgi:hypothetical protein
VPQSSHVGFIERGMGLRTFPSDRLHTRHEGEEVEACRHDRDVLRFGRCGDEARGVHPRAPMTRVTSARWSRGRWLIVAAVAAIVATGAIASCAPLGGRATGARLERMQKSPEWRGSHFDNPQPLVNYMGRALASLAKPDPNVAPRAPPSTIAVEPGRFASPPASGLRVTWLGHSTVRLEIDGHRVPPTRSGASG